MSMHMHVYTCVYVCVCILVHRLWVSVAVLQRGPSWAESWMHMCTNAQVCVCICVFVYICSFFCNECCMNFGTGVLGTSACAGVYVIQMSVWYQRTHLRHTRCRGAHICIWMYMCTCMHIHMDAYIFYDIFWHVEALLLRFYRLWYFLTRWGVVAEISCLWMSVHAQKNVYVCACMRVYVHVHMYVYVYMCVCVYVCIYMYIPTRVVVHMHWCRRILFICAVQPLCYMHMYRRFFSRPACRVRGGTGICVFFQFVQCLRFFAGVGVYFLAGVEIGGLSGIFLYFGGCWGGFFEGKALCNFVLRRRLYSSSVVRTHISIVNWGSFISSAQCFGISTRCDCRVQSQAGAIAYIERDRGSAREQHQCWERWGSWQLGTDSLLCCAQEAGCGAITDRHQSLHCAGEVCAVRHFHFTTECCVALLCPFSTIAFDCSGTSNCDIA